MFKEICPSTVNAWDKKISFLARKLHILDSPPELKVVKLCPSGVEKRLTSISKTLSVSPGQVVKNPSERMNDTQAPSRALSTGKALLYLLGAVSAFHLAYLVPQLSLAMVAYLFCLLQLTRAQTARYAFYLGLAVGLLTFGPHLLFFWKIFGKSAVALWLILAFWIGLFVALARLCILRLPPALAFILVPFVWTGLEYFRSELYYLRFSWLSVGYAFSGAGSLPTLGVLGMYGAGFAAAALAVLLSLPAALRFRHFTLAGTTLVLVATLVPWRVAADNNGKAPDKSISVAAVQLEFPDPNTLTAALDRLLQASPDADLFVLGEYTFLGPIPKEVKNWCKAHQRYLVIGGEEPVANNYYNTAFVIGPTGETVFHQAKCVPIQFFKDGLPAPEQKVWESPWGKIGICICYDLSYTRVTDRLVRQGAEALIVPTLDEQDWGKTEHELHARVAPVRAAEYGVPVLRVADSGISQLVTASGKVVESVTFPGQGLTIQGRLQIGRPGSLPLDRWMAPLATGITFLLTIWFAICHFANGQPKTLPQKKSQRTLSEPVST